MRRRGLELMTSNVCALLCYIAGSLFFLAGTVVLLVEELKKGPQP